MIVTVVAAGDYGKPRPAVVIQADVINEADPESIIVALLTSAMRDAQLLRLDLLPAPGNDLKKPSQVMVDKLLTVRRNKIGATIGRLTDQQLLELNRLLAFVIGLA